MKTFWVTVINKQQTYILHRWIIQMVTVEKTVQEEETVQEETERGSYIYYNLL